MKHIFLIPLLLLGLNDSCAQKNNGKNSSLLGVFVASTPCSQPTRPLPGIPPNIDCELIKWNLALYQDKSSNQSGTFILQCTYGMSRQGTTGFTKGAGKVEMEGQWTISEGIPSNARAVVYRLHDTKTNGAVSFLKLDDNLLHLLDKEDHLMTGTAAWSYTLNRITGK